MTKSKNLVPLTSKSAEVVRKWLTSFDTYLFDCDGVLWIGVNLIPGSDLFVNQLKALNKKIFFITNDPLLSQKELAIKATKLNFQKDIISSSYATRKYLQKIEFNKKVFVIAQGAITEQLAKANIPFCTDEPEWKTVYEIAEGFEKDPDIGAVLIGQDFDVSYSKLLKAVSYLEDPNCLYIATNVDLTFPMSLPGWQAPTTGVFLKALQTATKRKPIIVSKPSVFLTEIIMDILKVDPKKTIMFGDRIETDIKWGHMSGFSTMLLLSGVTSFEKLEKLANSTREKDIKKLPDEFCNKLGDIVKFLK